MLLKCGSFLKGVLELRLEGKFELGVALLEGVDLVSEPLANGFVLAL